MAKIRNLIISLFFGKQHFRSSFIFLYKWYNLENKFLINAIFVANITNSTFMEESSKDTFYYIHFSLWHVIWNINSITHIS
jgi:hypothetical protein